MCDKMHGRIMEGDDLNTDPLGSRGVVIHRMAAAPRQTGAEDQELQLRKYFVLSK